MTNEEMYALLTEEQKSALQNITNTLVEYFKSMVPLILDIGERIKAAIAPALDAYKRASAEVITAYPNKRVVWIATHHPKARVRKKNMHRIMRELQKSINLTEDDDE